MNRPAPYVALGCALLLSAAAAHAIDFPTMKAGLWESQITRDGAPAKTGPMKMCMDAAVQKEMMDMGMGTMKEMCSKNDIRRDGNRMYGNAECKLGESTMKSTSVTTFSGDVSYRTEVKATYDPPMMGKSAAATIIDSRWTGPCPAGMKAGDITMPDGRMMNMRPPVGGTK